MDSKTGSQEIVDFVNKRKMDEIKAISKLTFHLRFLFYRQFSKDNLLSELSFFEKYYFYDRCDLIRVEMV